MRYVPTVAESYSTLVDLRTVSQNRRGRVVRRGTIAVLTVFVLAGAAGLFGVKTRTTSASAQGYTLSVEHAWISRAGLDTPWLVRVHHPGGFDAPIILATDVTYFSMFESQGFVPEPDSETTSATEIFQEFAAPPGDTLTVEFDAYVQPSAQRGRSARTSLVIDGEKIATVNYRTRLVP